VRDSKEAGESPQTDCDGSREQDRCRKVNAGSSSARTIESGATGAPIVSFVIDPKFLPADDWDEIRRELRLSVREADIASLIVDNAPNRMLAKQLSISAHTVHSHLERLCRKLEIGSREELITRVFQTYVKHHSRAAALHSLNSARR